MKKLMKNLRTFPLLLLSVICFISFNCSKDEIDLGEAYVKIPDPNKIVKTDSGEMPVNQFAVIMKDDYGKEDAEKIAKEYGGSVVGEIEFINLFQIETGFSKEDELKKALSEVSKKEGVENALSNGAIYLRMAESISCDPLDDPIYEEPGFSVPYDMINLKDAWKYIKACGIELSEVNVGVNDDPLRNYSSELYIRGDEELNKKVDDRINEGKSFTSETVIRTDQKGGTPGGGHSNEVINILAANSKNGGISGVASVLGTKLKIKHIDSFTGSGMFKQNYEAPSDSNDVTQYRRNGKSYTCSALKDLQKQVENGSQIINCSFGTTDTELIKAYKKFLKKMAEKHPDVIFIGAAGDNNTELNGENDSWGNNLPNLVTVGMIDENGEKRQGTNYAGPDGEITISVNGSVNGNWGATSYCAPQVTGVIALMKAVNPELTAAQIKEIIRKTSSKEINGKQVDPRMGGCLKAADAVLWVINDMREKKGLEPPKLTKEYLTNLASLELKATDGPKDFTVTASAKEVSEKGTTFSIDVSGSNYVLKGDQTKSLSSAGSVTWDITLGEDSDEVTVKVKRLDTDGCAYIVLGGELKTEDLVGVWNGNVVGVNWSASSDLVRQYAEGQIEPEMGKQKHLTLNVNYINEGAVGISLNVTGGKPIPTQTFSFSDGKLNSKFNAHTNNYTYEATVEQRGSKLVLTGTWASVNDMIKMNGTWTAEKDKK